MVEFNQDGDVSAFYNIMNYQYLGNDTYDYVEVGNWYNHTLSFFDTIQPPPSGFVKSVCSDPCPRGYYKVQQSLCIFNFTEFNFNSTVHLILITFFGALTEIYFYRFKTRQNSSFVVLTVRHVMTINI